MKFKSEHALKHEININDTKSGNTGHCEVSFGLLKMQDNFGNI